MSLLVVGSVAFDGIETPFGKVEKTLGGAASYFALAASHFTPVRVVGIVGDDFTAREKAILGGRNGRIDLEGLEHAPGKSFFWAGRYNQNMNERTTLTTELNVFANFQPKLPKSYLDTSFIFLGNIQPTLQLSVLKQMKRKPVLVGLDSMNYWIERTGSELRETLKTHSSPGDQRRRNAPANRRTQPHARRQRHLQNGPARSWLSSAGNTGRSSSIAIFYSQCPRFRSRKSTIPTGAGDSFAGGFMGSLARDGPRERKIAAPRDGLRFGDGQLRVRALRRRTSHDAEAERD